MTITWKDIKQVPISEYCICVDIDQVKDTVQRYIDTHHLNLNPWFQRGHVWTMEQRVKYMEHLLHGNQSANIIMFNKPYWMKWSKKEHHDLEMTIIDGLQRLTTVLMFVEDKLEVFGQVCSQFGSLRLCPVSLKFAISSIIDEKELVEWYLRLNSAGTIHTEEELQRVKSRLYNGEGSDEQ